MSVFQQTGSGFSFMAAAMNSSTDQTSEAEKIMQQKALDEIIGVLLSAGYFRARVASLSAFDKVIGGLCWCITSSGTVVNVDIFYNEDLALGQKIQLSENIVKVLRSMGCPSPLQANQIPGGDYVAIFPIIRWLVTKVLEYRRITGDYVRMSSETSFDQQYAPFAHTSLGATSSPQILSSVLKSVSDESRGDSVDSPLAAVALRKSKEDILGEGFLREVLSRYRPSRVYRRQAGSQLPANQSLDARIQSCLLEFGERTVVKARTEDEDQVKSTSVNNTNTTDFDRKFAAMQRAAKAEEESKRQAAVALEASLLAGMTSSATTSVSGQNVGALVNLQAEELKRAAAEYSIREAELQRLAASGELLASTKHGAAAVHARRVAALTTQKESLETNVSELSATVNVLSEGVNKLENQIKEREQFNARAIAETNAILTKVAQMPQTDQDNFHKMVGLQENIDSVKEETIKFKASCRSELQSLQARYEDIRSRAADAEALTAKHLNGEFISVKERYARAQASVAAQHKEVQRLSRLLDEVPARAELTQYERRFLELFDEVSSRLDETRKYYTMYNTLEKKRGFANRQESLLGSIVDNFGPSMRSSKTQKLFLVQVEQTVASIYDAASKQMSALEAKKSYKDVRFAELQKLVEAQRAYYRAVRDLQEAAEIHQKLSSS